MAPRQYQHVLEDIRDAITGIQQATHGKTFEEFRASWVLSHAVQRGIEIISEAARGLPDSLTATRPEIPWSAVRGIGNVLRHEYHRVIDTAVWSVVVNDLPQLQTAIAVMLNSLDRADETPGGST